MSVTGVWVHTNPDGNGRQGSNNRFPRPTAARRVTGLPGAFIRPGRTLARGGRVSSAARQGHCVREGYASDLSIGGCHWGRLRTRGITE